MAGTQSGKNWSKIMRSYPKEIPHRFYTDMKDRFDLKRTGTRLSLDTVLPFLKLDPSDLEIGAEQAALSVSATEGTHKALKKLVSRMDNEKIPEHSREIETSVHPSYFRGAGKGIFRLTTSFSTGVDWI